MIKVLIIEDEMPAAERLQRLLNKYSDKVKIVKIIDSVEGSVDYLKSNSDFDLIFMDIQLGDGLSLEIFEQIEVSKPVIFVTAYDDYTLRAFKFNSIDYLLKPIDIDDLTHAMKQFHKHKTGLGSRMSEMKGVVDALEGENSKERFLVKKGHGLRIVNIKDIAYFYSEDGYLHIMDKSGMKHIIDGTLDKLYEQLDKSRFFKINRKMIVTVDAIERIDNYVNSRLHLHMSPTATHQVIVARERCKEFKNWLAK